MITLMEFPKPEKGEAYVYLAVVSEDFKRDLGFLINDDLSIPEIEKQIENLKGLMLEAVKENTTWKK